MSDAPLWKVSESPAHRLKSYDFLTKGINYISTSGVHWDKIEVHGRTLEGVTHLAILIAETLNDMEVTTDDTTV